MTLFVGIPSGKRRDYLEDIINTCGVPRHRIILVNTANNEPTDGVINLWSDELNIQKWWNLIIDKVKYLSGTHVAILNDDVRLYNDPLNKIYDLMGDATIGQPKMDSICGYCFVVNVTHNIRADESYIWWYGDNDLYEQAGKLNGVEKIDADVVHLHGNELTEKNPALVAIGKRDEQLWNTRHSL